ncbi:MAG: hypothetical protein IPL55_04080 [Saprospiraceae bacterium]|nr:hypothetical protein [Saprospiraceae bacterium]
MRNFSLYSFLFLFLGFSQAGIAQNTQQLLSKDFVIYSLKELKFPENIKIIPGSSFGNIGSKEDISFKKGSVINANVISNGSLDLDKELTVSGNLTANNYKKEKNDILKGDKNIRITGNLLINGDIKISDKDNSITGNVKIPSGASYSGPTPSGGVNKGSIMLPAFPALPVVNSFVEGTISKTGTQTLVPGAYKDITLKDGQTLTLSGVGTYTFNSIVNTSKNKVNIIYDFRDTTQGQFRIFVSEKLN